MDIISGSKEHLTSIVDIFNYYIEHTNARFETEGMRLEGSGKLANAVSGTFCSSAFCGG